jgi:RNA polymerase sigma factor (sigma-70 family)
VGENALEQTVPTAQPLRQNETTQLVLELPRAPTFQKKEDSLWVGGVTSARNDFENIFDYRVNPDIRPEDLTLQEYHDAVGSPQESAGDDETRSRHARAISNLVNSNMGLVYDNAQKFIRKNRRLSYDDLIQDGSMGLLRGVEHFDPEKGTKFSTYATYWIKGAIMDGLARQSLTFRFPAKAHQDLNQVRKAYRELERSLDRSPTYTEVATHVGLPKEKVRLLWERSATSAEIGGSLARRLMDSEPRPDEVIDSRMVSARLDALFNTLAPVEQDVIRLRYGLNSGEPKKMTEISDILLISNPTTWRIHRRAMDKLQQANLAYNQKEQRALLSLKMAA